MRQSPSRALYKLDSECRWGRQLGVNLEFVALAPCADVTTNPPGTFRDTFRAEVVLDGTVAGQAGTTYITYQGNTQPGGAVRGLLRVHDGTGELTNVRGVLKVQARAGVGGTYTGHLTGMP